MKIPLPGFKPKPDGTGYAFCPKCAAIWVGIAVLIAVVVIHMRRDRV